MSNNKLALLFACCAVAGISASCGESSKCDDGDKVCEGSSVKECIGGDWVVTECQDPKPICNNSTLSCSASQSTDKCTEGSVICDGNILRLCATGEWVSTPCGDKVCDAVHIKCADKAPECKEECKDGRNITCNAKGEASAEQCKYGCNEDAAGCALARTCEFAGISYGHGETACTSDNQISKCDNGTWVPGTKCSGDKPVCENNECVADKTADCKPYLMTDGSEKVLKAGEILCDGDKLVKCEVEKGSSIAPDAAETDCTVDDNGQAIEGGTCGARSIFDSTLDCIVNTVPVRMCVEGEGQDAVEYNEGDNVCASETEIKECRGGEWVPGAKCSGDKPVCVDGECVAFKGCTFGAEEASVDYKHGDKVCISDSEVSECVDGEWVPAESKCGGEKPVCVDGECVECMDADTKCVDSVVYVCADHAWDNEFKDDCTTNYTPARVCAVDSGSAEEPVFACVDPVAGCTEDDACNATNLETADSCKIKFNDEKATGSIRCSDDCTDVDYRACLYCGDGKITAEQGEACDGENIGNATCADLDSTKTWKEGGIPGCKACQLTEGTCEELANGYFTIRSIKDDYDVIAANEGKSLIEISGVVTAVANDHKAFILQDADGTENAAGVYVYCGSVCDPGVEIGNNVTVKSAEKPTLYKSLLEIVSPVTTIVVASGIVTSTEKTIAELLENGAKNTYDSMLVTIKNVNVQSLLYKSNSVYDVALTDGKDVIYVGSKFSTDGLSWFSYDFKYDVTGTIFVNNRKVTGAEDYADITHIAVRTMDDVVEIGCVDDTKTFVAATDEDFAKCIGSEMPDACVDITDTYRCVDGVRQICKDNVWTADACADVTGAVVSCDGAVQDFCKVECRAAEHYIASEDGCKFVECSDEAGLEYAENGTSCQCKEGYTQKSTDPLVCEKIQEPECTQDNAAEKCINAPDGYKFTGCVEGVCEYHDCASGYHDESGSCVKDCTAADNKCVDMPTGSTVTTCDAETHIATTTENVNSCKSETEVGDCFNSAKKCDEAGASVCKKGVWDTATPCDAGCDGDVCRKGECTESNANEKCTNAPTGYALSGCVEYKCEYKGCAGGYHKEDDVCKLNCSTADDGCKNSEDGCTVTTCNTETGIASLDDKPVSCKSDFEAGDCLNGAKKCDEAGASVCSGGIWGTATPCDAGCDNVNNVCNGGECTEANAAEKCIAAPTGYALSGCVENLCEYKNCASGYHDEAGKCVKDCTAADNKCVDMPTGSTVTTCDSETHIATTTENANSCKSETNVGDCFNSAKKCDEAGASVCRIGVWDTATPCDAGCNGDECREGQCTTDNAAEKCTNAPTGYALSGCVNYMCEYNNCASGYHDEAGKCVLNCSNDVCNGEQIQYCDIGGKLTDPTDCPNDGNYTQSCQGGVCRHDGCVYGFSGNDCSCNLSTHDMVDGLGCLLKCAENQYRDGDGNCQDNCTIGDFAGCTEDGQKRVYVTNTCTTAIKPCEAGDICINDGCYDAATVITCNGNIAVGTTRCLVQDGAASVESCTLDDGNLTASWKSDEGSSCAYGCSADNTACAESAWCTFEPEVLNCGADPSHGAWECSVDDICTLSCDTNYEEINGGCLKECETGETRDEDGVCQPITCEGVKNNTSVTVAYNHVGCTADNEVFLCGDDNYGADEPAKCVNGPYCDPDAGEGDTGFWNACVECLTDEHCSEYSDEDMVGYCTAQHVCDIKVRECDSSMENIPFCESSRLKSCGENSSWQYVDCILGCDDGASVCNSDMNCTYGVYGSWTNTHGSDVYCSEEGKIQVTCADDDYCPYGYRCDESSMLCVEMVKRSTDFSFITGTNQTYDNKYEDSALGIEAYCRAKMDNPNGPEKYDYSIDGQGCMLRTGSVDSRVLIKNVNGVGSVTLDYNAWDKDSSIKVSVNGVDKFIDVSSTKTITKDQVLVFNDPSATSITIKSDNANHDQGITNEGKRINIDNVRWTEYPSTNP